MSRAARFFWVCAASAGLCFVALGVLSKGSLEPAGYAIFDSNFFGYDRLYAVRYLGALNPEQIALYMGAFRQLDTLFPALLAISLGGALWVNTGGRGLALRAALVLVPVCYLGFDLSENAAVAQVLRAAPVVEADLVARASGFTKAKWVLLLISVLLVLWAWRRGVR